MTPFQRPSSEKKEMQSFVVTSKLQSENKYNLVVEFYKNVFKGKLPKLNQSQLNEDFTLFAPAVSTNRTMWESLTAAQFMHVELHQDENGKTTMKWNKRWQQKVFQERNAKDE